MEAVRNMPPGSHAVLVYDSQENKRDVLFEHLKVGADTDGLVYACSEETPASIRSGLEESGMDVEGLERKGLLTVKRYDHVYIVDGKVNTPGIISSFSDLAWDYNKRGLRGVRAAGEMSCFFKERKIDELINYERALHRKLSFPGKGICGYSLVEMSKTDSIDLLWPILRAHGLVIMTGPTGSFALEPEQVTGEVIERTIGVTV